MAKSKKAKWMLGLTSTAFSAFVIGQIGTNQSNESIHTETLSMNKEEKNLVQLDWSNYSINGVEAAMGREKSDRKTRRS
ncbi:hypothetical protein [Neobacillus niacini]|uniref:hypothetical protein n=1 Tax=Neobacillus niacini TaxID=86668 RepID=UPI00285B4451|nr:hypothetical protein [Neobacillus niacini]MDR6998478.1 hypothetical protein [Neobacillus niacini]